MTGLLEVYPRVYGGTLQPRHAVLPRRGLSPRVRGNRNRERRDARRGGSIPACTGEPGIDRVEHGQRAVYPRVYGGTIDAWLDQLHPQGLSPRVRGNPCGSLIVEVNNGSIPACTGEPAQGRLPYSGRWVYPRVYGGTPTTYDRMNYAIGLSPRVRGNPGPGA